MGARGRHGHGGLQVREYSGGEMVVDKGTIERILEVGIRRVARNSGVDRKTVALIAHGKAVKPSSSVGLALCLRCTSCYSTGRDPVPG